MKRMMHCCALSMEIHIPDSGSLKSKRNVVKHLLETCRVRFGVAVSEVGHQDRWQRSALAFAAIGSSPGQVEDVLDAVERYVWSHPEVDVLEQSRCWLEHGGQRSVGARPPPRSARRIQPPPWRR
jgi:hypothetical protein